MHLFAMHFMTVKELILKCKHTIVEMYKSCLSCRELLLDMSFHFSFLYSFVDDVQIFQHVQ